MGKANTPATRNRLSVARPKRGTPSTSASTRKAARVGIELDGGVAHVVTVAVDGTVQYERLEGASNAVALGMALRDVGRNDAVRIALTSDHQSVRRLAIPNVPDRALPIALRTVAEEHMPMAATGIAVAGLIPNDAQVSTPVSTESTDREMTIAAVSSAECLTLRPLLGPNRILSVSSFLLPTDGLYLRVARVSAELILIRNGTPMAVRSLRAGGISDLGADAQASESTVFLGTTTADSAADAYVDSVVGDVRRTIVFWRREGMNVPDQIAIIGEGASLAPLEARLRDASYEIVPTPVPQGLDFHHVDPQYRAVMFQALAAALVDLSAQPSVALSDASVADVAVVKKRDPLPIIVAAVIGVVIIALLGFSFYQRQAAGARLERAQRTTAAKNAELVPLTKFVTLKNQVDATKTEVTKLRDDDSEWAQILQGLYNSAPPGTQIKSIGLTKGKNSISATANASVPEANDPAFKPVAVWQDNFLKFQKDGGGKVINQDAWVAQLTKKDRMIEVAYTASIDAKAFKPGAGK
ncbi:MAG: hypothetical protein ACOYN3_09460 [Acidimicrobiia bacterium]